MIEQLSQAVYYINILWDIIKNWWWVFLPFIITPRFLFFWRWWRMETWMFAQKKILLEIKMPKEVLKPIRAMEQVFYSLWGNLFDPADWWEHWFEGKCNDTLQLEIASLGGEPHFYIRCSEPRRNAIESSVYAQYPEAEISVVEDYTKLVPNSLPNKDWELWGTDYRLIKPDVYPILTYSKFFEEKPDTPKEEKRIDPVANLLEGMSTFRPGEYLWIQFEIKAISNTKKATDGEPYYDEGRKIADELAKRPKKAAPKSILGDAVNEVITGQLPGVEEKKELSLESIYPPELRLTPGEKDIVTAVENKITKRMFSCYARFIYLAKRDLYLGAAKAIPFGFLHQFAAENLNQLIPLPRTLTKIKKYPILNLLRVRRLYRKKRRLFFRYINRWDPFFPKPGGRFLLNAEELATIYHFPGRTSAGAPSVSRVESKRGEAPAGLPLEEE
ncbi:MAG: hypothetical protein ABH805_00050 [Candidatus Nealsonbacteria bacterium]